MEREVRRCMGASHHAIAEEKQKKFFKIAHTIWSLMKEMKNGSKSIFYGGNNGILLSERNLSSGFPVLWLIFFYWFGTSMTLKEFIFNWEVFHQKWAKNWQLLFQLFTWGLNRQSSELVLGTIYHGKSEFKVFFGGPSGNQTSLAHSDVTWWRNCPSYLNCYLDLISAKPVLSWFAYFRLCLCWNPTKSSIPDKEDRRTDQGLWGILFNFG